MFSFTSMGGKINHTLNRGGGPYTFALSGMNYHTIGNLLPPAGKKPVFSQLYIHDTSNEVKNRIDAVSSRQRKSTLQPSIVQGIKDELDRVNPFVQQFRSAAEKLSTMGTPTLKMVLLGERQTDARQFNLPSASEVAALVVGDFDMDYSVRDIIIESTDGDLQRINELHPSYLPLQYPLLFPFGEDGYRDDIKHRGQNNNMASTRKRVSIREFLSYKLMFRAGEVSSLLHASTLLQQFIVDVFTMMESQRLMWYQTHQKELRADLYKGLSNAVQQGHTQATSVGKRVVLPSSFTGGARYMMGNYQDAMTICRAVGYPDLFITFTCNPAWPEISRLCRKYKIKSSDCPQVVSRVFYNKLQTFMKILKQGKIFGKVKADIYTIEFQKRGLPHAHILLFLENSDKISSSDHLDTLIHAEIPNREQHPELYDLVEKFMMHGPCGHRANGTGCIVGRKKCSKHFPKPFTDCTAMDDDGYPTYRRRDDGRTIEISNVDLDNRFVVPYNPTLLQLFHAYINVEKCNQSRAIKYLFKYISKGGDRVVVGLTSSAENAGDDNQIDEVQQYLNCRYVSASEASWRAFGFPIHYRFPAVQRLSFHLPDQQFIVYSNTEDVTDLLTKPRVCESQFLSWMEINSKDKDAAKLTYSEFPNKYVYQKSERTWKARAKGGSVGRMPHISPMAGELYYLRILLTHVRGPKSYDDIKTFDGTVYETFKEACFARGLLDDDSEYISALQEASVWALGHSLRRFFVSMLLCGSLHRPCAVWDATKLLLSEDMLYIPRHEQLQTGRVVRPEDQQTAALLEINRLLMSNGKTLSDFADMPVPDAMDSFDYSNHLILQERSYDREALASEAVKLKAALNTDQEKPFQAILTAVQEKKPGFFFVYGFGGTGKTFLWNVLASTIRSTGGIVLTVASSGIAATLLPGGRTAHSRFAIPMQIDEFTVCSIFQNSPLANLLKETSLIIWDEAPMVHRLCVEAFNRSLQDIMHSNEPFGGKCIVMGGDFRQILPVIPKASRSDIVAACINASGLWSYCQIYHLTINMRLQSPSDPKKRDKIKSFSNWLLDIGDGKLGSTADGLAEINLPDNLVLKSKADPVQAIAHWTYDGFLQNLSSGSYFNDRAILAPTIEMVNQINDYMCALLPGEPVEYLSCDTVCPGASDGDMVHSLYSTEFLNSISASGMPPHRLILRIGTPVMLLRNIDQEAGLCNGTRLRISKLGKKVIEGITLNGSKPDQKILIHRMDMNPSESRLPFKMQRRQFPIILSFAMTINKSQGQSLKKVGLYLTKPVFSHGQLYVALSRVRNIDGLKIVLGETSDEQTTTNVVYKEVFANINNQHG